LSADCGEYSALRYSLLIVGRKRAPCDTLHARAFRDGEGVGTAHVESTVNELINWRFCKKQQMSRTRVGAQTLLHVKTAELNGTLHRYTLRIQPGAMAACPPTFFTVPLFP
jgi:hypothetical protein